MGAENSILASASDSGELVCPRVVVYRFSIATYALGYDASARKGQHVMGTLLVSITPGPEEPGGATVLDVRFQGGATEHPRDIFCGMLRAFVPCTSNINQ